MSPFTKKEEGEDYVVDDDEEERENGLPVLRV